jgi:UDP-N-acetylmuramate: L-alanyl-gamma-D-glutamyl-meso-diaminopimelate ligase
MIMHVLKYWGAEFDYLVGAQLKGFETNVKLTDTAPVILIEGDEYLSSRIHPISKFLYYKPHVALISGIAWDHYNVFPDYKDYLNQFKASIESIEKNGTLIYNTEDKEVRKLANKTYPTINKFPYHTPGFVIENHKTFINKEQKRFPVKIFGAHNLQNLQGARLICNELGISDEDFYKAIADFEGASRRLELVKESSITSIYSDFAHAPSKVKATVEAVKEQYPGRQLIACLELHTYSSLNKEFISEYKNCLDATDRAMVYFNPETLKLKGLPKLSQKAVKEAFNNEAVEVFTDSSQLVEELMEVDWREKNLLLMTSGNFDGLNFKELADKVIYRTLDQQN